MTLYVDLAYLRIATHPAIFASPLSSREALANGIRVPDPFAPARLAR